MSSTVIKTAAERLVDWAEAEANNGLVDVKFFANPESSCASIELAAECALALLTGEGSDISDLEQL